jgi:hypothetical protein
MKKATTVFKVIISLLIVATACNNKPSANLIFNGSAEIPKYDSIPKGWQNIKGNWVSAEGDSAHHDYAHAQDSSHYFFGGYGLVCILQQDADVSKYAKTIDDKKQKFIVSGFEQTLDQGKISDQGMLKIECLDASKNKTLYSDSTDTLMSKIKWQAVADTFSAPSNTRFIRVQLIAFRNVGGDNDGYFDNISLTAIPAQNNLLIIIIVVAIIIFIGLGLYFRKRKIKQRNHNKKSITSSHK